MIRTRLQSWLAFAVTLAAFAATFALMLAGPAGAAPVRFDGVWRVTLAHPGGELPFGLEIGRERGKAAAWLLNPPERLRVEQIEIAGDKLTLAFPSYGSRLTATLGPDGKLTGEAVLRKRVGLVPLALKGERGTWRFAARPARPAADLSGRWIVESGGDKPERGLAQFRQTGSRVTGSVQFPTGDTRYLAGDLSGGTLALSTFDGNASSIWRATLVNGVLAGESFGATSKSGSPWRARRAGRDDIEAVEVVKSPVERLAFSFPTSDGKRVSLSDPRYRGKVVVITLGGAWCPNCHDEAAFLGPYATKRKGEGLEVIGLQFEYGDDQQRAFGQMDKFAARYRLPYPLLLAGQPTPESSRAALPGIGGVKVYPSAIFIGRDGRVREIHIGWSGPATGPLNAKAKRDFDATVSRLLREKA